MTNNPFFGEVQYCFQAKIHGSDKKLALISNYSPPDQNLLSESSGALIVCQYKGVTSLEVIPVKTIMSCIAMIPFREPHNGKFFVCEKMGLDVAFIGGSQEDE